MKLSPYLHVAACSCLFIACSGNGEQTTDASDSQVSETDATSGTTEESTETSAGPVTDTEFGTDTESGTDTDESDTDATDTDEPIPDPVMMQLFDEVVFYDGYAGVVDEPVPEGVIRHRNSLYAIKFTDEQLDSIQTGLEMGVIIGALCDNYDRIGSANLAFVPKGAESYNPDEVMRVELGRFITPFMDMNKQPDTVPYEFKIDHVVPVLTSEAIRAEYDLWVELDVFGVPYAANNEVAGCAGRNDVFRGSLLFYTDSVQPPQDFDVLLPIAMKEAFNNYADGASDMVGTTTKTRPFTLEADAEDVQLVLITSNHGANAGGEEYIRRAHYIYTDMKLVHDYVPGRETCEPFRVYNTQGNGIYGPSPKSDDQWQAFSNWCPGDVITTRILELGPMAAGEHSFVIDVPLAVFKDGEGNFPFSLFVQAKTAL